MRKPARPGLAQTPSFPTSHGRRHMCTPTGPLLSVLIVTGKFADDNVPGDLQDLIIAESGANDGLGHTFSPFRSTSSSTWAQTPRMAVPALP
ncbi:Na/H antiporter [Penicillium argentinense]|uniref:Na/H antiporter n=1 Tax=Penicillium argentinense TaxID=1131581 RepID=A0A9W9G637_9EURO|nr:Na/H antiporter [Penicillium argentinense]KAJ5112826.1 Na/H antiporter [Penicillium argentinense]